MYNLFGSFSEVCNFFNLNYIDFIDDDCCFNLNKFLDESKATSINFENCLINSNIIEMIGVEY